MLKGTTSNETVLIRCYGEHNFLRLNSRNYWGTWIRRKATYAHDKWTCVTISRLGNSVAAQALLLDRVPYGLLLSRPAIGAFKDALSLLAGNEDAMRNRVTPN